jgi:hypothetical protein
MADLIKPKDFTLDDMDGVPLTVTLSRFDAVTCREVLAKYPLTAIPKISDYSENEATMFKLMSFVAVDGAAGQKLRLSTRELIKNHTRDGETLMKIEMAMLEYNCSFFQKGRISDFLGEFVQMIITKISEISTPSSARSSAAEKPLSTNSEPSTT